jgi:hypothetical protein
VQSETVKGILKANLTTQFKQANGQEPTAEELEEMIDEMKEAGLYDRVAERISALLRADEQQQGEGDDEQDEDEVDTHCVSLLCFAVVSRCCAGLHCCITLSSSFRPFEPLR